MAACSPARSTARQPSLSSVARARSYLYALAARALSHPSEDQPQAIRALADRLAGIDGMAACLAIPGQWRALIGAASDLASVDFSDLEARYISLFEAAAPGVPCPPYESAWLGEGVQPGLLYADVERAYARGRVTPTAAGDAPDHVAIELEFIALLCHREAAAWRRRDAADAGAVLRVARSFFERHLVAWLPQFSAALVDRDPVFWGPLAEPLVEIVLHDRHFVTALAEHADPRRTSDA